MKPLRTILAVLLGFLVWLAVVIVGGLFFAAASARRTPAGIPNWYPYAAALLSGAGTFVGGALASRPKRTP